MTKLRMAAAIAPGMVAVLLGGPSLAQAAAPAVNWGAPISGVCVLGRDAAIRGSTAGASVASQLKQLTQTANSTFAPEEQSIKTEQQALRAQASTLTPAALQQRSIALNKRVQTLQENAQSKDKQLSQAQNTAVGQILQAMDGILPGLVSTHRCSLVLERGGTYGSNPAMDITQEVVAQLNAKMPSVTVTLPAAPAPAR